MQRGFGNFERSKKNTIEPGQLGQIDPDVDNFEKCKKINFTEDTPIFSVFIK